MTSDRPYHHGALRPALLAAAAAEIAEVGPAAMSLRKVAARAGVTHAAAAHHFGDKRGLLTALAAEGHRALADALTEARPRGMLALGDAYLRFAHEHRPWFEVMFRADLVRTDDPDYAAASSASFANCVAPPPGAAVPRPPTWRTAPGHWCTASPCCRSPAPCRRRRSTRCRQCSGVLPGPWRRRGGGGDTRHTMKR